MLATHVAMIGAIVLMAWVDPAQAPYLIGLFALMLSFFSASHDIVKDAYRVEILPVEEQGAGSGAFVMGYRIGMLLSGAGALYLASNMSWNATYVVMALVMSAFLPMIFFIREPEVYREHVAGNIGFTAWTQQYVVSPFTDFMKRPQAITIILFILLYRMTDAFIGLMANPFYLELGFSKMDIVQVVKLYGLVATIIGGIIGGAVVLQLGVIRALWVGGIASALSNLMFIWQAHVGPEPYALALTISLDNLSAGLATSAFVAYMAMLCNTRFTATQFALLSSLGAFGRTWLSTPSGYAAEHLGWDGFFILSSFIVLPALIMLARLTNNTSQELKPPLQEPRKASWSNSQKWIYATALFVTGCFIFGPGLKWLRASFIPFVAGTDANSASFVSSVYAVFCGILMYAFLKLFFKIISKKRD